MRTTLAIDDVLLQRAKRRAERQGITLGRYVEEALRRHLVRPLPAPSDAVALPVNRSGALRPGIDPSSNSELFELLDEPDPRR
ncbi:MAG: type II toxin-antitoxin system VapB family antitoxin [Actinomycetia bacterium]|nr:type II toxin-antitoxin system VapB family antitoxin [Actinomycetes bacterium]